LRISTDGVWAIAVLSEPDARPNATMAVTATAIRVIKRGIFVGADTAVVLNLFMVRNVIRRMGRVGFEVCLVESWACLRARICIDEGIRPNRLRYATRPRNGTSH
jgi:hypothetical protein